MKILTHLDKWCDEAFSCKERELVNMSVNNNSHQTEPSLGTEPKFRDKHVLNVKHSQMQSSEVTALVSVLFDSLQQDSETCAVQSYHS